MFGSVLNTYGSNLVSIHHSYFYTYHFSPVAHKFPSLALYSHGAIEAFFLAVPYVNIYDISEFYQPHIISIQVLHQIGILTCDSHHNFAAIQGIGCEINFLKFCTLWKGVCTDLFSISDYVCRLEFDSINKHSDNAPTSLVDEIQGVSPLPSCRLYTPAHDHGVHDFFSNSFIQKQFSELIKVKMKIC